MSHRLDLPDIGQRDENDHVVLHWVEVYDPKDLPVKRRRLAQRAMSALSPGVIEWQTLTNALLEATQAKDDATAEVLQAQLREHPFQASYSDELWAFQDAVTVAWIKDWSFKSGEPPATLAITIDNLGELPQEAYDWITEHVEGMQAMSQRFAAAANEPDPSPDSPFGSSSESATGPPATE